MKQNSDERVDYYMELAQRSLDEAEGPDRALWIDRLEEEHANLREVFNWLIEQCEAEQGLRLAYLLQELWFEEHHTSEARQVFTRLLAMSDESVQPAIHAQALDLAGAFALAQNDFAEARALTDQAVDICRGLEDKDNLGSRLVHLGHIERYAGNYPTAQALYQEALQIFQALDRPWWIAVTVANLASTAVAAGNYAEADRLVKESLQRFQVLDSEWELALIIGTAAGIAAGLDQHEDAIRLAGASAAHRRRIGVSLPPIQSERFEQMIVSSRQALDEPMQTRFWHEGQAMTLKQAVKYVKKTSMPTNEREELAKQSKQALEEFVRQHPGFSIDEDQPEYRGGTNLITFGHFQAEPIVFKYFIRTYRWNHEYFCLRHFADTGHVPKILAVVPDRLIVMTRYPDTGVEVETLTLAQRELVSREIGQAVGDLVQWPLPIPKNWPAPQTEFEQFNWRTDVGDIITTVLARCRQIQAAVPAYQTPFYNEALTLAEQHIAYIEQQPRVLFHEDFPNMSVHQAHFQGFYDLEMARIGTEAHQLGVALDLVKPHWIDGEWLVWPHFIQAYQETTGRILNETDFLAILAMSHFYYHLRLSRWGEWDGDPAQTSSMNFATSNAEDYHTYMKRACYSLRDWIDLYKWFPSLR